MQIKFYLIASLVILSQLIACSSTPNSGTANLSVNSPKSGLPINYFQLGKQSYQLWTEEESSELLLAQAYKYLEQAYQQQADQVNIQYYLYRVMSASALVNKKFEKQKTETLFTQLHPVLYPDLTAPAFIEYLLLKDRQDPEQVDYTAQLNLVKKAIKQNPYSPYQWLILSELYEKSGQADLAVASANIANLKQPDTPAYMYQLGSALNTRAEASQCVYAELEQVSRSALYLAKASKLAKNTPEYTEFAAFQYLRLGLFPISFQLAKASFEAKPSYWSALIYAESALLLKKYQDVEIAIKSLRENYNVIAANRIQVLMQIELHQTDNIISSIKQMLDAKQFDSFDIYLSIYADQTLNLSEKQSITYSRFKPDDPIVRFLKSAQKESMDELRQQITSPCSQSDIEFFIGFKALIQQNYLLAQQQFELVLQQKAYRQSSYFWARALLNSKEVISLNTKLDELQQQAKAGNAQAQHELAVEYRLGSRIEKNIPAAIELWHAAAEQNYAKALLSLGYLYRFGYEGIELDYAKAFELFSRAAEQGDAAGIYALGNMYYYARYVDKNDDKAFELYSKSAELNNKSALYGLALMYQRGDGTQIDKVKAYQLLQRAAEQGYKPAIFRLGLALYYGDGVDQNKSRALEGLERLAESGYVSAQSFIGAKYLTNSDYKKAAFWNAKAAVKGDAKALNNLGDQYENGFGVEQDYQKAIKLYQASLDAGGLFANVSLAYVYAKGLGVSVDFVKAVKHMQTAAIAGISIAQEQLGLWYLEGKGVDTDEITGIAWLKIANSDKDNVKQALTEIDLSSHESKKVEEKIQLLKQALK
ncbi:tetratricopeptide repeat protein [Catenovulum maritimum]|uniref:SEL1-like repeat protein n=1 Tax=Catenovulum maritimum TaxID=1513271 RepID=UPI00065F9F3B|nr:tetratricopeptide repeat protein [Catenovulum maritimum]